MLALVYGTHVEPKGKWQGSHGLTCAEESMNICHHLFGVTFGHFFAKQEVLESLLSVSKWKSQQCHFYYVKKYADILSFCGIVLFVQSLNYTNNHSISAIASIKQLLSHNIPRL